jgi:hypothetical protein
VLGAAKGGEIKRGSVVIRQQKAWKRKKDVELSLLTLFLAFNCGCRTSEFASGLVKRDE